MFIVNNYTEFINKDYIIIIFSDVIVYIGNFLSTAMHINDCDTLIGQWHHVWSKSKIAELS